MATSQTSAPKVKKPTKAQLAAAAKMAEKPKMEEAAKDDHTITPEQRQADRRADDIAKTDAMSQFVNQQTAPALQTPPSATEAFQRELAELQKKHGVTVVGKVKMPKVSKDQRNGITRPAPETICGKIWATADAISAATHTICPIAALKEHKEIQGMSSNTIKTQYQKWRAFNGVLGRLPKLHAVHQVQGEYDAALPNTVPPKQEPEAEPKAE